MNAAIKVKQGLSQDWIAWTLGGGGGGGEGEGGGLGGHFLYWTVQGSATGTGVLFMPEII